MKYFFTRLLVVLLLFSITAETFSSLFQTSSEQLAFGEKEDSEKKKEEVSNDEEKAKDKFIQTPVQFRINECANPLYAGFLQSRFAAHRQPPPEMPPELV